jgi:anti-sigma regulatory factor (Ser/Thr protein kinase)
MDETLHVTLAGGLDAPRLARAALHALNASLAELRFPVTLLVSELVTKAVTHGHAGPGGTFSVRTESGPDRVHAVVAGAGTGLEARPGRPIDPIEDGFGLALLDGLSDRWGVEGEDGTAVWFEIDHSGSREEPREASAS